MLRAFRVCSTSLSPTGASQARRCLPARRFQSSAPAPPSPSPADHAHAHITKNLVWGLWNEGNLFSLSLLELQFFLEEHLFAGAPEKKAQIDFHKKSVLVRQVEELLSAEQTQLQQGPPATAGTTASGESMYGAGAAAAVRITDYDRVDEGLDEADEYGDWGVEPGFDKGTAASGTGRDGKGPRRSNVDFLEISPTRMGERYDVLAPRSYQLLHSDITSDLVLQEHKGASKLPGQSRRAAPAFTVKRAAVDDANRSRFKKAFEWSLLNIWNLSLTTSELNINAGRALFYADIAKQNKTILPVFALQRHIYAQHPYVFFSIATESNRALLQTLATEKMGLTLTQDETTSYKVMIKRGNMVGAAIGASGLSDLFFDCELNENLNVIKINRPWDRLFVMHYVRSVAPDLRYVVRSRHPLKKKIADLFLGADGGGADSGGNSVLKFTRDSVQSILSPELGEVFYCCERKIRKWSKTSEKTGVTISLVETKRTPLIISKIGDEGERLEYEFVVDLPHKGEKVNISELGDEIWDLGRTLATSMEEGMADLGSQAVSTSAAFY